MLLWRQSLRCTWQPGPGSERPPALASTAPLSASSVHFLPRWMRERGALHAMHALCLRGSRADSSIALLKQRVRARRSPIGPKLIRRCLRRACMQSRARRCGALAVQQVQTACISVACVKLEPMVHSGNSHWLTHLSLLAAVHSTWRQTYLPVRPSPCCQPSFMPCSGGKELHSANTRLTGRQQECYPPWK